MPPTLALPQFSSPQIEATSGLRPRLSLADLLHEELPNFYAARQTAQQNKALDLTQQQIAQQNQALDIQARSLQSQEEAQASAQRQQTIGTGISAVGTVGQAGLAAKQLGLFGSKTATGLETIASPTPSLAGSAVSTGTAAVPGAASEAALTTGGVALDTGGAATTAAAAGGAPAVAGAGGAAGAFSGAGGGLVGGAGGPSVAGIASAAGAGYTTGTLAHKYLPIHGKAGAFGKWAIGGLAGAASGFALGGPIGAIVGGIAGNITGLLGGGCPIHSAAFGHDSVEVAIARQWRDTHLSLEQLRCYYVTHAPIATRMDADPVYRLHIRTALIDPLIRYGAHQMGVAYKPLQPKDRQIAEAFLQRLAVLGKGMGPITRPNGEVL